MPTAQPIHFAAMYGPGHYVKHHCDGPNELYGPIPQKSFVSLHISAKVSLAILNSRQETLPRRRAKVGKVLVFQQRMLVEIRNTIFTAILTEYTPSDLSREYPPSVGRPGYNGPGTISVAFLLTCRRIYLETYHLPPQIAEHVFWHAPATGPSGLGDQFPDIYGSDHEQHHFARLMPWQLPFVKEVKLSAQMFWLDYGLPGLCTSGTIPAGIECLRIMLRRGDWWFNEWSHPFTINPHRGGFLDEYNEDVGREERGAAILREENGWGSAFQRFPALRELEMEFETSVDWQEELKKVVERVLRWKFPIGDWGVLGNKGLGM